MNENHIESLIMLGSCRMSQCRFEEAEAALVKAAQLINKMKCMCLFSWFDFSIVEQPEYLPNYDSREFLAKMILELPNDQTYV